MNVESNRVTGVTAGATRRNAPPSHTPSDSGTVRRELTPDGIHQGRRTANTPFLRSGSHLVAGGGDESAHEKTLNFLKQHVKSAEERESQAKSALDEHDKRYKLDGPLGEVNKAKSELAEAEKKVNDHPAEAPDGVTKAQHEREAKNLKNAHTKAQGKLKAAQDNLERVLKKQRENKERQTLDAAHTGAKSEADAARTAFAHAAEAKDNYATVLGDGNGSENEGNSGSNASNIDRNRKRWRNGAVAIGTVAVVGSGTLAYVDQKKQTQMKQQLAQQKAALSQAGITGS